MSFRSLRTRVVGSLPITVALLCLPGAPLTTALAEQPNATALGKAYQAEIRPLFERYCYECHGVADVLEGDINLAAMKNWDEAVKHPKTWQKVAEMLGNGLMPPEDDEQPTAAERRGCESGWGVIWHSKRELVPVIPGGSFCGG